LPAYVLTTVGTSLLSGLRRRDGMAGEEFPDVLQTIGFLKQQAPQDRQCGAEINSLWHLLDGQRLSLGAVTPPACVDLLVSDTADGAWTGEVLSGYLRGLPQVRQARSTTVTGLDDSDPRRFANAGLRSLVKLSCRLLAQAQGEAPDRPRLINATGGFKAQISFAVLVGQALKVPVVYLFEKFPHCIEMPPMPVDFDRGLWIENYGVFAVLSEEGVVRRSDVLRLAPAEGLMALLDSEEVDGVGYVSLSPVLEVMHQAFGLCPPQVHEPPPDAGLEPEDKLHLNEAEMAGAPRGSRQQASRLAGIPWVTRVENIRFLNTARSFVKVSGVSDRAEFRVVHSDGDMGLEFRLRTTCATDGQRQWCLDQLRDAVG